MNKYRVAVYGTLRAGFGNHRRLLDGKSTYLGDTTARGTMYHLGGYPAVKLEGNYAIKCEVYEVDGDTLKSLDRLEGIPTFYQRSEMDSIFGKVFIYTMDDIDPKTRIIESGDWAKHE